MQAQCFDDRHNSNKNSSWTSCETSLSPNGQRGSSHWIMYNLNNKYPLGIVHFWNHNHPAELDNGVKDIVIDISNDGESWTQVATYIVPRAEGSGFYEGLDGPNLNGHEARYVLITVLNNHGGECVSLGELRIGISNVPDPCMNEEMQVNNTPIYDGLYHIRESITSEGLVNKTGDITFKAGELISLDPGFEVEKGASFTSEIEPCNQ